MQLGQIMTAQVETLKPTDTLEKAFFLFNTKNFRHIPIVDRGHLVGIVSEREVKKILPSKATTLVRNDGKRYSIYEDTLPHGAIMFLRSNMESYIIQPLNLEEIMIRGVVTAKPTDEIYYAAGLMADKKIGSLPILENNQLAGIVTTTDILRALIAMKRQGG